MRRQNTRTTLRAGKATARFAVLGLVLAVIQAAGCASAPLDETSYNSITGYPAVGDQPWRL